MLAVAESPVRFSTVGTHPHIDHTPHTHYNTTGPKQLDTQKKTGIIFIANRLPPTKKCSPSKNVFCEESSGEDSPSKKVFYEEPPKKVFCEKINSGEDDPDAHTESRDEVQACIQFLCIWNYDRRFFRRSGRQGTSRDWGVPFRDRGRIKKTCGPIVVRG